MNRIEVNCTTGESVAIQQFAYTDSNGAPVLLDEGAPTEGFTPITFEQYAALTGPTADELEEIKRKLLAEAMVKRDFLIGHLERLRTRAIEANNTTARDALSTAITSLEGAFNDQRVIDAVNGDVEPVLKTITREIGLTLGAASPASLQALLALDAL